MQVFISIPRRGQQVSKTCEERTEIFHRIQKAYETPENSPVKLLSYPIIAQGEDKGDVPVEDSHIDLILLGLSLQHLMYADITYFADGWDNDRKCRIEHAVCREYNIPIIGKAELERREQERRKLNESGVSTYGKEDVQC